MKPSWMHLYSKPLNPDTGHRPRLLNIEYWKLNIYGYRCALFIFIKSFILIRKANLKYSIFNQKYSIWCYTAFSMPRWISAGIPQKSTGSSVETKLLQGGQYFLGLPRPLHSILTLCAVPHFGQTHSTVRLLLWLSWTAWIQSNSSPKQLLLLTTGISISFIRVKCNVSMIPPAR